MNQTIAPGFARTPSLEPSTPQASPLVTARPLDTVPPHLAERVAISAPPEWVVERSAESPATPKSGSNPVLLFDRQCHARENKQYVRTVQRLDTMQAVHTLAQWRLEFDPATEDVTIHSLAVCREGQRSENAHRERLRFLHREENLERLIIDGQVSVMVLLENVRCGDVLDLSFTIRSRPRIFPDRFRFLTFIPSAIAIHQWCLSIRFPRDIAMKWKSSDSKQEPAILEDGDDTLWNWKASNPTAIEPEPNVPSWHFADRWIQVGDFETWAEVASGLTDAWPETLDDPDLLRLIESWDVSSLSTAQRAVRALEFVQDEIRYLSLNTGLGGQIPSRPGSVITRGFGDCKDKSFLAAHLLRHLGIPARPILVHTRYRQAIQDFLPSPNVFDHAIVEFEIDGDRRWVDVTISQQGGSATERPTPSYQLGLPVSPGVDHLDRVKSDFHTDRTELRETYFVDTAGRSSALKVVAIMGGREADDWRQRMAMEGPEAVARHRENWYQQFYPRAKRIGEIEWRDHRDTNEFIIAEVYDLQDVVIPTGDGKTCLFPFRAHLVQSALIHHSERSRKHPWALPYPCRVEHIVEIDSPGLAFRPMAAAQLKCAAFRFHCTSSERQGFLSLNYSLRTMGESVPAADYAIFMQAAGEAWAYTSTSVQLPLGSSAPWWKKLHSSNLPVAARRNGRTNRIDSPDTASPPPLPAQPAPILSTTATRPKGVIPRKSRDDAASPSSASGDSERKEIRRPNPPRSGQTNHIDQTDPRPTVTSRSVQRSSRSRKRKSGGDRRAFLIALAITAGATVIIVMIMLLLRHVETP